MRTLRKQVSSDKEISNMPFLTRICIYPMKSLDGVMLTQSTLLKSGTLEHDRRYAFADEQGRFVNGKRNQKVHLLRSRFDRASQVLTLRTQDTNQEQTFHLNAECPTLNAWLSNYFGFPVH